jgi:hypothetical protein
MIPKKASSLYKQVAEDLDLDEVLIENFVDFYYKKVRDCMSNLTHPRLNIDGLGQFIVRSSAVKKAIPRFKKSLENHDTSTFGAYFNKKRIELKLDLLIVLEQKIISEENRRETFIKEKDEKYTKTNLGEQEPNN